MDTIYIRKAGPEQQKAGTADKVKPHCHAELILVIKDRVKFKTEVYLPVDFHSHYYVKRKSLTGLQELWLIELDANNQMQGPYTYTATFAHKFRDVEENWVEDI